MREWFQVLVSHLVTGAKDLTVEIGLRLVDVATKESEPDLEPRGISFSLKEINEVSPQTASVLLRRSVGLEEDDESLETIEEDEEVDVLVEEVENNEAEDLLEQAAIRAAEQQQRTTWKSLLNASGDSVFQIDLPPFGQTGEVTLLKFTGAAWGVTVPMSIRATVHLHPELSPLIDGLITDRSIVVDSETGRQNWNRAREALGKSALKEIRDDEGNVVEFRVWNREALSLRVRPCVEIHGFGNEAYANLIPQHVVLGDKEEISLRGPLRVVGSDNALELQVRATGCVPDEILQKVSVESRRMIVSLSVGLEVERDDAFVIAHMGVGSDLGVVNDG